MLIALFGGCGGSSDSSGGDGSTIETSSLSKEEFIEKAGAACQKARENILSKVLRYTKDHESMNATRSQELQVFTGMTKAVVLPIVKTEITAIRNLGAPSGEEDEVEAFVNMEEEETKELAKKKTIVSRFELERYLGPSAKLFREYGLEACANG